jgi:hypothetical protein
MRPALNPVDLANRRYIVQLALAMIAYAVILITSIDLLKTHAYAPGLRDMIAVTPALQMLCVV